MDVVTIALVIVDFDPSALVCVMTCVIVDVTGSCFLVSLGGGVV